MIIPILILFQLAYPNPSASFAINNWNSNGCVTLQEAKVAPLVIGSWKLGRSFDFAGTVLSFPETQLKFVIINESALYNEFHLRSGFCHEIGHVLGLDHSENERSCMSITWTSDKPAYEDLIRLREKCQ